MACVEPDLVGKRGNINVCDKSMLALEVFL